VNWPLSKLPAAFGVIVLGALAGAAIGMTIGTLVTPRRINIMFAVVLTPIMFTGSTQFPWRGWPTCAGSRWSARSTHDLRQRGMRSILVPGLPSLRCAGRVAPSWSPSESSAASASGLHAAPSTELRLTEDGKGGHPIGCPPLSVAITGVVSIPR